VPGNGNAPVSRTYADEGVSDAGVRSPLGEWRNAAPAERYSAKAVDAARGTQHADGQLNAPGRSAIPAGRREILIAPRYPGQLVEIDVTAALPASGTA